MHLLKISRPLFRPALYMSIFLSKHSVQASQSQEPGTKHPWDNPKTSMWLNGLKDTLPANVAYFVWRILIIDFSPMAFGFVLFFFFLMKTFAVALGYWAPVDKYRWVNYEVTRAKLKHLPANWIQQTASWLSHQLLYTNLFCIFKFD